MVTAFPGRDIAVDFRSACAKWMPLNVNDARYGSIWTLKDALPGIRDSVYEVTNGFATVLYNCEVTLEGGLKTAMREGMVQVHKGLAAASTAAGALPDLFAKVYAEDEARRGIRGGQTLNV